MGSLAVHEDDHLVEALTLTRIKVMAGSNDDSQMMLISHFSVPLWTIVVAVLPITSSLLWGFRLHVSVREVGKFRELRNPDPYHKPL